MRRRRRRQAGDVLVSVDRRGVDGAPLEEIHRLITVPPSAAPAPAPALPFG